MSKLERLGSLDMTWLQIERETNLMQVVGVLVLETPLDRQRLETLLRARLLRLERFSQHVLRDSAGAIWESGQVDMSAHIVDLPLPAGDEQAALEAVVSELAATPLDPQRPLWQLHLVGQYRQGSALIVRIHHCIADGIALISVTLSLVDGGSEPPQRRAKPAHDAGSPEEWLADTLIRPFTDMAVKAIDMAGESAAHSLHLLREPEKMLEQGLAGSVEAARMAYQLVSDAAALALMPDDSATRLKGKPGHAKRVAWCPPIPLDEVKAIGKALNCSVNDVLLSCVAGAIGGYLRAQGDDPAGQEIRAMIPVNLRPMEQAWKLGNHFGLVPLVLPIGIENPIERVYEVRQRMNALKGSTQPLLAFAMLSMAGMLVKPAQDALLNLFARKTTAVMTNVPGPRDALTLCGARVTQCMFWVPQSGDIGLGVSILSYGGGVQFGVITDTTLCPEPQQIIDAFAPEFDQLSLLTLMLPWGE